MPGFRTTGTALYERLSGIATVILEAIGVGLGLDPKKEEQAALMKLQSGRHSQLRLLHYPGINSIDGETLKVTRLPAHTDWGTFTLLFQDDRGGLELRDPRTREYMPAVPEGDGVLVLNVGDMLQRFTNGESHHSGHLPKCERQMFS